MGIDPAEGELLIALLTHQFEVVVAKPSIVTVVMLDPDTMHGSKLFKCLLGFNGFRQGEIAGHEIHELEPCIKVNKDHGVLEAGLGKYPFGLAKEAWFRQLKVVNRDASPWLGGNEDNVLDLAFFTPPRNLGHGTKQAAGASGSTEICQSLGDLTVAGKLLEPLERKVSETIVPTHQLSLVVRSLYGVFFGLLEGRRRVEGQGGLSQGVWMLGFFRRQRYVGHGTCA